MNQAAFLNAAILAASLLLFGCDSKKADDRASPSTQPHATSRSGTEQRTRGPAVAGLFYPSDKNELAALVDTLLADAKDEQLDSVQALICPHAGYRFSGPTAAAGFRQLMERDVQTVIVLAPTHYAAFQGASIPVVDAYQTPLGTIPLSLKAAELAKTGPFVHNPPCRVQRPQWWRRAPKELPPFGQDTPHTWEHSLEVELPFLQKALGQFSLVPIVFGKVDPEAVAKVLVNYVDDETVIVASSDLSHYYRYSTAEILDRGCVDAICNLDIEAMAGQEACGKGPILTLMHLAKRKGWEARLLDYRNSGDTGGDRSGVVGYAAIAFLQRQASTQSASAQTAKPNSAPAGPRHYSSQERQFLLNLASEAVAAAAIGGPLPQIDPKYVPKKLTEAKGCFVTLKKADRLRGCIGYIFPREPLCRAVIQMAQAAAVRDRRFPPVRAGELSDIRIEISVLTVPRPLKFRTSDELLAKLRPRIDGIVLRSDGHQATYLPQVWRQMPDKRVFLTRLCLKAGVDPEAWRQEGVAVLTYQAESFQEGED